MWQIAKAMLWESVNILQNVWGGALLSPTEEENFQSQNTFFCDQLLLLYKVFNKTITNLFKNWHLKKKMR